MSKISKKKIAFNRFHQMSDEYIEKWKETGDEKYYVDYDAMQTILEELYMEHVRPFYKPVTALKFVFKKNFRSFEDLKKAGFTKHEKSYTKFIHLHGDITLYVEIPNDFMFEPNKDVTDYVTLLDDSFGQPYTPFYMFYCKTVTNFPFLQKIIIEYNKKMQYIGIFSIKEDNNENT